MDPATLRYSHKYFPRLEVIQIPQDLHYPTRHRGYSRAIRLIPVGPYFDYAGCLQS